jgi:hypothetical protein
MFFFPVVFSFLGESLDFALETFRMLLFRFSELKDRLAILGKEASVILLLCLPATGAL